MTPATATEAKSRLERELEGVDNATDAARALSRVVRRLGDLSTGSVEAFKFSAERALAPWFPEGAKPTVWAIVDTRPNGRPAAPAERTREEGEADRPRVQTLETILKNPSAIEPPVPAIPHLAWKGRVTLFAAREKMGKSTLASAAIARVSSGASFLGEPTRPAPILLAALEEHVGDVASRLAGFHPDPARIFVLDRVADPFETLEAAVEEAEPEVVVVDTLSAFVAPLNLDPGSSRDWTPVMARLTRIARDRDLALLILHHGSKKDGRYRDSTAIGAGVDVILEMDEGSVDGDRKIRARGRWNVSDLNLRFLGDRFELTAGEVSLDARILLHLERKPGASTRSVRESVGGKAVDVQAALARLEDRGAIENRPEGAAHRWFPVKAGTGPGTGGGSPENPQRTATEPVEGTGAVPDTTPLGTTPREPVEEIDDLLEPGRVDG